MPSRPTCYGGREGSNLRTREAEVSRNPFQRGKMRKREDEQGMYQRVPSRLIQRCQRAQAPSYDQSELPSAYPSSCIRGENKITHLYFIRVQLGLEVVSGAFAIEGAP